MPVCLTGSQGFDSPMSRQTIGKRHEHRYQTSISGNSVRFVRVRKGTAFYAVVVNGSTFEFPVALADIGDATLLAEDRAMFFMRYIRLAMEAGMFVQVA